MKLKLLSPQLNVAAVAFPVAVSGIYDYLVPEQFKEKIAVGVPVLVEIKSRKTWGVVVELKEKSSYLKQLKKIIEIKEGRWADSGRSLFKLYKWMADYYQCPLGRIFKPLVGKTIISAKAKTVIVYRVKDDKDGKDGNDDSGGALKEHHQQALNIIKSNEKLLTGPELEVRFGIKASAIALLFKKGYLVKERREIIREADELSLSPSNHETKLSDEQREAVEQIGASIENPQKPFLLYGVTGSGKTHVYTELAKKVLALNKGVIILVPEISLTPQTIARFKAEIGDTITVIHSHMSDGERRDSLQEIVAGQKRAVIGVRSALLVPMDNVGLIIVDEEHDGSYKQSDTDPRYNARDVAVMRGMMQKAVVVLGSATPSLESYHNSLSGKYHLIPLTERFGGATLPEVKVIDMAKEHQENNWTPLSRYLVNRIEETLNDRRQIILLLNRRGFSPVLLCKECGYSHACPNCSVNLRYHKADTALKCHLCGYEETAPDCCPKCKGKKIKYKGTGIQKAEELLKERFPLVKILRMDQDTTRRKGSHIAILDTFAKGEADILLGTQMVAKGLNFPKVTLVGVLQADTGLYFPDFRATERTFQLLTQVAGRAGRAELKGEVIIQTYFPNESAIKCAMTHDYLGFYHHEIENRRELFYPPFGKVARVVAEGIQEKVIEEFLRDAVDTLLSGNSRGITILGPAPAALSKIDKVFRYTMLLKSSSPKNLSIALSEVRKMAAKLPSQYRCVIDVDPVNML